MNRDYTDAEFDNVPVLTESEKFQRARQAILSVAKKHRGEVKTYAFVMRSVPPETVEVFEDALRDVAGEGLLTWRQHQPAPSLVRF